MGLIVNVYRAANFPDCTRDGVSGKFDRLTLVNVPGPFEPSDTAPAAWLVKGNLPGCVKIVVCEPGTDTRSPMMGGNYAASSDSRFGAAVEKMTGARLGHPVAIHDRYE